MYNSMIMCQFCNPPAEIIVKLLTYSTGRAYKIEDLDLLGERIFNLKRILNIKLGVSRKDDYLPKIVLTPLKEGGTEGRVPNIGKMIQKHYEIRKWDYESGKPTEEKLKQLGLDKLQI